MTNKKEPLKNHHLFHLQDSKHESDTSFLFLSFVSHLIYILKSPNWSTFLSHFKLDWTLFNNCWTAYAGQVLFDLLLMSAHAVFSHSQSRMFIFPTTVNHPSPFSTKKKKSSLPPNPKTLAHSSSPTSLQQPSSPSHFLLHNCAKALAFSSPLLSPLPAIVNKK